MEDGSLQGKFYDTEKELKKALDNQKSVYALVLIESVLWICLYYP